ncbi:hypothetical protein [Parabacteroides timonensis]|uniref:hypothetical protein n=1 Tax=Parabacteroides timonensis TaxID=1871013 RepID=UPI00094E9C35|nr:hypothetical protein [Parabacteroides timonensis]
MWNKLMIGLLLLVGSQAAFSQVWLGKTDKDFIQFVNDNKERIKESQFTDKLFTMVYQEEDELGRLFDVTYRFTIDNNICTSYQQILPAHSYWAATIQEQASQQEADASGETIDVDGETLNTHYQFDDYDMLISMENDRLILQYNKK